MMNITKTRKTMQPDFDKMDGLVPAIIQDSYTQKVLMLGFMNKEAYEKTLETGKVTFYSRTKQRLWTKGETSGNFLEVVSIKNDCDNDTLLIQVHPTGPVCHTGTDTCWGEKNGKNCKTLSTNVMKKCPKSHTPQACSNPVSIKWHRK